jgi:hypothetical protein
MLFVGGCAALGGAPQTVGDSVQVESDQFSKDITLTGVGVLINPLGGTVRKWFIRSWINKDTHAVSHQLYVSISYTGDWKFFQWAADDTSKTLEVVKIDSHVDSCSGGFLGCDLSETVGITLDDATLRGRATQGYQIKLSAKSGDALILDISPEQITKQLAAVDAYTKPSNGSAPAAGSP